MPLVVSFTFRFLFTLVDLIYAAEIKEEVPYGVAAIGLFIPIQTLFIALWAGLSAGFTATMSQAFGKRDQQRVVALKRAMIKVHIGLVPILLALGAAVYLGTPALGLDAELQRDFLTYSLILILTMPFAGLLSIYPDSIVKAHHDTMSTMKAGILSTIVNVALNTVFVFVFHWGIAGIATATALSRYAGLGYAAMRVRALEAKRLAGDWDTGPSTWRRGPLADILVLAIPGSLAYSLVLCEESLLTTLLTYQEDAEVFLAAYAVFNRLTSLAMMPAIATAVAVLPFAARLVAEGECAKVRQELLRAGLATAALAVAIAIPIGWIFSRPVAEFFSESPEQAEASLSYLALIPLSALSILPYLMLRPVFEAVGRPRVGIRLAALKTAAFSVPCILSGYGAAPALGIDRLTGILLGVICAQVLTSVATTILSRNVLREPDAPAV